MGNFCVISLFLLMLCAPPVFSQQANDDEPNLDEIAVDNFVHELRSERSAEETEPVSADTIEEWLAGGSSTVDRMVEYGCELDTGINSEIQGVETRLARLSSEASNEVRALKLQLVELRQRAIRDCCEQESVTCFE